MRKNKCEAMRSEETDGLKTNIIFTLFNEESHSPKTHLLCLYSVELGILVAKFTRYLDQNMLTIFIALFVIGNKP